MAYGIRTLRSNGIAAVLVALAGCAPQPFDATSPWSPLHPSAGRSFAGGQSPFPPGSQFARFEQDAPPAESINVPSAAAGNPWAQDAKNVVVQVCYARLWASRDDVDAAARDLCPTGARLRYLGSDTVFNGCPLVQPSRAVYRCLPPESGSDGASADDAGDSG